MIFLSKFLMFLQITTKRITNTISHHLLLPSPSPSPTPTPIISFEPTVNNIMISCGELDMVMNKLGLEPIDLGPNWFGSEQDHLLCLFEDDGPSLEELIETFNVFDENKDGFIDGKELRNVLIRLGLDQDSSTSSSSSCERMIRSFDENGDGLVDFREFVKLMEKCFL